MTRYVQSKQDALREQSRGKNFLFLHFKAGNTIYRIIQFAENRLGLKRRIESGRKPKIMATKGSEN